MELFDRQQLSCHTETDGCITCGDAAVPLEVTQAQADGLAVCTDTSGTACEVDVGLVGPVSAGDVVLVHANVALALLKGGARG